MKIYNDIVKKNTENIKFYDQNNLLSFSDALEKASNSKNTEVDVEQISLDRRIKLLLKFVNN